MNCTKKRETTHNNRTQGSLYEQKVRDYLIAKGYTILTMNYRCKIGEIDMIAKDHDYTVFIEVKYRSHKRLGYPRESVDWRKQHRIIQVAYWYLSSHGTIDIPCRFDVVEVLQDKIVHIQNAFGV